jgi:hypothetical protein
MSVSSETSQANIVRAVRWLVPRLSVAVVLVAGSVAQDGTASIDSKQADRYEKKTFVEQNGTQSLARTLETEHHVSSDGEVDIQRYKAPSWSGDERVSWEREVRTRKLPDGSIEKEYILRNPDGAGQLVPIQVTHEKTTPGADSTSVHREVLQRLGGGELQPVQKEQITEKGSDNAKQVFKEVQRLDTASHEWRTVERETSSVSTTTLGDATEKEKKSIKQTPNAYGGMTDYERRQERTASVGGKETHESTVYRRDNSTSEPDRFFLLDHTTETTAVAPGITTRHVVRESERNMYSHSPEVVSEQTVEEKTGPDGSRQTVIKVSERTGADPSVVRATYMVTQESDSSGYVRRIFIPAQ